MKIKIITFICLFLLLLVLFYEFCIVPIVTVACEEEMKVVTNNTVNVTAASVLSESDYESLFVSKNNQNNVEGLYYVNAATINQIALKLCSSVQNQLFSIENRTISLNLSTMSGIVPAGNIGPNININVVPINSVCYEYSIKTQSVGINQVHYGISLNLNTTISLLIPGRPKRIQVNSEVVIVDCIIAGDVPQVIFNGTKTYDLVP